jgi:TRAP transporter TAXI family solute receptor
MKRILMLYWSILFLFLSMFFASGTMAQADRQQVGMVTGSATGTYIRFGHEIAEQAKKLGIDILVKESKGSIENIERLVSKENAAFAIVQSDVLGVLKRSESSESRKIAQRLRLIYPFYNEEVHLFANKTIQRFADLQGKRVVVGTKGSGNWLTAENLLQLTEVAPGEKLYIGPAEAVQAILLGEADAMFYVVGKPTKQFLNLNDVKTKYPQLIEKVHFVPLDDPRMLEEYVASEIGPQEYAWTDHTVSTIAVKAVLVTYDFSTKDTPYYRMRCEQISQVAQAIRENIDELRAHGHAKWNEVNLDEELGFWEADQCSRQEAISEQSDDGLANELEKTIKQGW